MAAHMMKRVTARAGAAGSRGRLLLMARSRGCGHVHHDLVVKRFKHANPWADEGFAGNVAVQIGDRSIEFSTGRLARFADGQCVVQIGDTSVLVTAVHSSRESSDVALKVDFRQKAAAAGRIPMTHLRRERSATDYEILTSRVIDRSLRPMFPKGYRNDTQVTCNILAVDGITDPDIASINGASAALALSDIPWNGPIGAVRVGLVEGEVLLNPTRNQLAHSKLNLVIAGANKDKIVMLEASADNISHSDFLKCIKQGLKGTQKIVDKIKELRSKYGKEKPEVVAPLSQPKDSLVQKISQMARDDLYSIFTDSSHHKISRDRAWMEVRQTCINKITEEEGCQVEASEVREAFQEVARGVFRGLVLEEERRCDGRALDHIRPIHTQVDLYSPLHGSAIFQRGQTQCLCTVTFDSIESTIRVDPITAITGGIKKKNFMLHYQFPPYATNEIGNSGMVGRREIGHGALAEKALLPFIPQDFPFTIRLSSEVLESNGSSSMASVSGGSLALMDAGVPLSTPVSGIAAGLVTQTDPEGNIVAHKILTDILGIEDYMGDMDFKMAGTKTGITALQADVKLPGIPIKIVGEALVAAHKGNKAIIKEMEKTIKKPRQARKPNSPVSEKLVVPLHLRPKFTGPGGYNLRKLAADTGVSVTPVDTTSFSIFAPNPAALEEAKVMIDENLNQPSREPELEFGRAYTATITELRSAGVMVSLHPDLSPVFIHNSQLDRRQVNHPSALLLEVGQEISVKYFGRDPVSGGVRLSRKALQAAPLGLAQKNLAPPSDASRTVIGWEGLIHTKTDQSQAGDSTGPPSEEDGSGPVAPPATTTDPPDPAQGNST